MPKTAITLAEASANSCWLVGAATGNRAARNLLQSSDCAERILTGLFERVFVIDRHFTIVGAYGPTATQVQGKPGEQAVIGRKCYEVLHRRKDWRVCAPHDCPAAQVFKTAQTALTQHVHFDSSGDIFTEEVIAYPFAGENRVVELVAIHTHKIALLELDREKLRHDLDERTKELRCLHSLAGLLRSRTDLDEILSEAVALLPPAWHYPEITRARIRFEEREFVSHAFEETEWKQASEIVIDGEPRGTIEIFYLEPQIALDEGPFLREERQLIESFASTLSEGIERVTYEQDLIRAKEAAELASRAKDSLLANLSHEIRTPLSLIMGCVDLAMTDDMEPSGRREHLRTAYRNAEHVLEIITGILELSRIEADNCDCDPVLVDCAVQQIVDEVATSSRHLANQKHLDLRVHYISPLPATIRTSPLRVKQILLNLVDNAVKFTESGSVDITVRMQPREVGQQILFEVADTGVGIAGHQLAEIFRPFVQGDMSLTRRFGGTGLGLATARRFAHSLGGRIAVRSEPRQGSTFTLVIDLDSANQTDSDTRYIADERGHRRKDACLQHAQELTGHVLLVDDDMGIQAMIDAFVKRLGHVDMDFACDGLVGCEKALESDTRGTPYDLILMDIRMPKMDGYEATRRLRRSGWTGPIVAFTAQVMEGDRERCLDAGCDEYMPKPSAPKELRGILARYLATSTT